MWCQKKKKIKKKNKKKSPKTHPKASSLWTRMNSLAIQR